MTQNIKTVPNQKTISNDVTITGRFFQVDEETFTAGCNQLKPTTFLVWQALNLQYFTNKKLALSTSVISELMGNLRMNTVKAAINELIEKGWLVVVSGNHYSLTNPVVRKVHEGNDDVVRKVHDASCEKCTTGSAESARERIIKEKENNIYEADASAAKNINEEKSSTESLAIESAASEDALASSGFNYINEWNSKEQKYRNLFKPIQESNKRKMFVQGTIVPWHYNKNKSKEEQEYYDTLSALELWNKVKFDSAFNAENKFHSMHNCFSLERAFELWNAAETFVSKNK